MVIRTVGELKAALESIPDDTPLVRSKQVAVNKAHFSAKDGSFVTYHYGNGWFCCKQAKDGFHDTVLRDCVSISYEIGDVKL